MKRLFSYFCIILGISLLIFTAILYWQRTNPNRLSFELNEQELVKYQISASENHIEPVAIVINSLSISLPIHKSKIIGGQWESTKNGVSYLEGSPIPGEIGNSILYGHNWKNLLGSLPNIKPGDNIEIYYKDKTKKEFEVYTTQIVDPTDVSILNQTADSRITLYTCTGFLDSQRFVVVAILNEPKTTFSY